MKRVAASLLSLLVGVAPALAQSSRLHGHRPHIVGTDARRGEAGFPITTAKDSIRINAVGEVISQPVPVIQKERNFDDRARQQLTNPPPPSGQPQP